MYPITLTNCLKYIARVIYGKRKNRDFLFFFFFFRFFFFLKRPSTKLGQLQAIKIIQSCLDIGRTWSFDANRQFVPFRRRLCEIRKFLQYATPFTSHEPRVRCRACIFSLIDLAHEHIYSVRASDIRVDIQVYPSVEGRKTIRNGRLGSDVGRLLHALNHIPCSGFLYLQFLARCHPYILFLIFTLVENSKGYPDHQES